MLNTIDLDGSFGKCSKSLFVNCTKYLPFQEAGRSTVKRYSSSIYCNDSVASTGSPNSYIQRLCTTSASSASDCPFDALIYCSISSHVISTSTMPSAFGNRLKNCL